MPDAVREYVFFFFSSRRRHTRLTCDWSSDVWSSDLPRARLLVLGDDARVLARVAEHEEASPWAPLHVENSAGIDFGRDSSAVTLFFPNCYSQILPYEIRRPSCTANADVPEGADSAYG